MIALVEFMDSDSKEPIVHYTQKIFNTQPDNLQKSANFSFKGLKDNSASPELTMDW